MFVVTTCFSYKLVHETPKGRTCTQFLWAASFKSSWCWIQDGVGVLGDEIYHDGDNDRNPKNNNESVGLYQWQPQEQVHRERVPWRCLALCRPGIVRPASPSLGGGKVSVMTIMLSMMVITMMIMVTMQINLRRLSMTTRFPEVLAPRTRQCNSSQRQILKIKRKLWKEDK